MPFYLFKSSRLMAYYTKGCNLNDYNPISIIGAEGGT
jgi:hypothetical protein